MPKLQIPLAVQVGLVAAMFLAALVVFWITGALVVARERRRSEAKVVLDRAGDELAASGREIIARAGQFPDFPEAVTREMLDQALSAQANAALSRYEGIDGGFLVLRFKSFLGVAKLRGNAPHSDQPPEPEDPQDARSLSSLPPLEADLIDIQVDAAIRKGQILFSVSEIDGEPLAKSVAIRSAPVTFNGRIVGASWVMTRLVDSVFADRSLQGYRLVTVLKRLAITPGVFSHAVQPCPVEPNVVADRD